MPSYQIIIVSKFRKGTDARSLGSYPSKAAAEQRRSETNWAGKRGSPHIVESSKAEAFIQSRLTGIFAPGFKPPTPKEVKVTHERKKRQEAFERETEAAKAGDRTAQQLVKSKYGIRISVPAKAKRLTPSQLKKEKARARQERAFALAGKIRGKAGTVVLPQARVLEKGLPLTILGIPKRLKVDARPLTEFEKAQQRDTSELFKLIGRESLSAIVDVSESVREGVLGGVSDFATELLERPIGKVETGFEEVIRKETLGGRVISETRKKEKGQDLILFPVISETARELALGAESSLEFLFEDIPKGVKKAGEFVISEEGRKGIMQLSGQVFREVKERPIPTLTAAGTIATVGALGIIKRTGKQFATDPVFTAAEAVTFGEVGRFIPAGAQALAIPIKKFKFERGISKFEKRITDPTLEFDTRSLFRPTGKKEVVVGKRGIEKVIVETEEMKPGFLTFGEAGEITGRQATLPGRLTRAELEAQAEFIGPRIGIEKVIKPQQLPLRDFFRGRQEALGARFRPPVTKFEKEILREPPGIIKLKKEEQLFFRKVFPPGKKGQISPQFPEDPFLKFEEFTGDFFGRIKRKARFPKLEFLVKPTPISAISGGATLLGVIPTLAVGQAQRQFLAPRRKIKADIKAAQRAAQRADQRAAQEAAQRAALDVMPRLTTDLSQLQDPADILDIPSLFEPPRIMKPSRRPKPSILDPADIDFSKTTKKLRKRIGFDFGKDILAIQEGQAYNVFAREKGKLIKVNEKPLLRTRAQNLGADVIDNSAAASFILKKTNKDAASFYDDPFFFKQAKFRPPGRKSKLPQKTFIEKDIFRIDTPGEIRGITAKGWLAQKKKGMLDDLGFGLGEFKL